MLVLPPEALWCGECGFGFAAAAAGEDACGLLEVAVEAVLDGSDSLEDFLWYGVFFHCGLGMSDWGLRICCGVDHLSLRQLGLWVRHALQRRRQSARASRRVRAAWRSRVRNVIFDFEN